MSSPFYGSEIQDEVSVVENPEWPEHIEMYNGPNEYGYDEFANTAQYEPEIQGPNVEVVQSQIKDDVDRTHERANTDRPIVRTARPNQWSPQQLPVGDLPTVLVQNDPRRHRCMVENVSEDTLLYVGASSNMRAGGYGSVAVEPGDKLWMEHTNDVWAVIASDPTPGEPGDTITVDSYEGDVVQPASNAGASPATGGDIDLTSYEPYDTLVGYLRMSTDGFELPSGTSPTFEFYIETSPDGVVWTVVETVPFDLNVTGVTIIFDNVSVPVSSYVRFSWLEFPGDDGESPTWAGGTFNIDNSYFRLETAPTPPGPTPPITVNVLTEWFS